MSNNEQLGRWLRRLLVQERFGPIVLCLRDGTRLEVVRHEDVRVRVAHGTIEVAMHPGVREILLEDVLSVGLPKRSQAPPRATT